MNSIQLRRMDEIEGYRKHAYAFSRTDRLGNLIKKSLELTRTVVRDGTKDEALSWDVKSLAREGATVMNDDANKDDMIRSLMYGLSASMGSMIQSVMERSQQRKEGIVESQGGVISMKHEQKSENTIDSVNDSSEEKEISNQSDRKRRRSSPTKKPVYVEDDESDTESPKKSRVGDKNLIRCNQCNKGFSHSSQLERHLRVHSGDRPFTCEQCPASFITNSHLKEHMRNGHGEKPHGCPECGETFTW
ncbi:hypothetical protein PENTCL1PPCAC_23572, partial [Pristionchus entomophagus]